MKCEVCGAKEFVEKVKLLGKIRYLCSECYSKLEPQIKTVQHVGTRV